MATPNTYVINAPVANVDGSVTIIGTRTLGGQVTPIPVSVTLNASGIALLVALPNAAAVQQAIAQLFDVQLTPAVVPVAPPLPTVLNQVSGTIIK